MASKNVTIAGASYSAVPAVLLPVTGGGTARYTDTSDATVDAANMIDGYTAYGADGTLITGALGPMSNADIDAITGGGGGANLQDKTKSYTPTESAQTETVTADTGYDGLSSVAVSVAAISSTYVGSGITRRTSSDLTASGLTVTVPSGYYEDAATKTATSPVKTSTTTFTGNGTRSATFSCDFEPDLVYWISDPGTSASSGTVAGIIVRDMMAANRYRNNSTTNSHYAFPGATGMNTAGSSYSHRATYDATNREVTLYCWSNNARSLFTSSRTYTVRCVKWTS